MMRVAIRQSVAGLTALLLAIVLGSCTGGEPIITPTITSTPSPTLTPSPTPIPAVVMVASAQPQTSAGQLARQVIEQYTGEQGWILRTIDPGGEVLEIALQENPKLVVCIGSGLGQTLVEAANSHPNIPFVAVEESGVLPAANLLVIGGDNIRHDQMAFMAGLMASIENGNDFIGWIGESGTVRGKIYRNAFRHGVRYLCPLCTVFDYELASNAEISSGLALVDQLVSNYVDTASALPGPAADAALAAVAQGRIRVAGARPDFYDELFAKGSGAGAGNVLGGPAFRPDLLLESYLPRFLDGETFSDPIAYELANGGLEFAEFPNEWISPGQQDYLRGILAQVASGRLDIGVDPSTGDER